MLVKGSVVKSISRFVKEKHSQQYASWLDRLPAEAKSIFTGAILATEWYPVESGVIVPTELIADMFFSDSHAAAWKSGRFSAKIALSGIYKVFVFVSTPAFIMSRSRKILSSFYQPTNLEIVDSNSKSMTVHITELPCKNVLIEHRIGGWMEQALEICGCKGLNITITKSMVNCSDLTEYEIAWK